MQREEIEKAIRDILEKDHRGMKLPRDFPVGESLFLRGVIDSFGVFPFVRVLEARFHIKIGKRDIHPGNLETIENLISFVFHKKNKELRE